MRLSLKLLFGIFITGILACKTSNGEPEPAPKTNQIYYVSDRGNDSGSGSSATPFQTINFALSKATPADTVIVRQGEYHEKVVFPKSGLAGKFITLKAYPNERPVIDGTGLTVNGKDALVTIKNVNYVVLEGFDIANFKSSTAWVDVNGIMVYEGASNITIRKNRIYSIQHNVAAADGRSGHGIEVRGNTNVAIKNVLIEENEIYDCKTGYSENLTINGYVDGFVVRKNKVYNGENIGIVVAGGYAANAVAEYNYARNGVVEENEVFALDGTTGPIPAYNEHNGAIGIYVDGARNITVDRNKVHDCGRGIGIVSETNNFPTRDCIVRNNFVYNNSLAGIYLGGYIGYTGGGTRNCHVLNNTTYFNSTNLGYSGEIEGEIRITADCHDNVIKNNIIYARPNRGVFVNKQTTDGNNNVLDYNLYYSTGTQRWNWDNIAYTNFVQWKSASKGDVASTVGIDPQLVSTTLPDLHIAGTSSAKNSGTVVSLTVHGEKDIDNQARIINNKISKGAQQ